MNIDQAGKNLTITGRIVRGVKQAAFFTGLEWFQSQCRDKLGFAPYAGTLNLEISADDVPVVEALAQGAEIEFIPPDSACCSGKAYPVIVEGLHAAIVIPAEEVRVHGEDIVEVISGQRLKDALKVDDGDFVTLTIASRQ
jgi:CTP-dependent riboflavin kinase